MQGFPPSRLFALTSVSENCLQLSLEKAENYTNQEKTNSIGRIYDKVKVELYKQDSSIKITDLVPAYSTLLIFFDFFINSHHDLIEFITQCLKDLAGKPIADLSSSSKEIIKIPTYYDSEVASELHRVALLNTLSEQQVVELHSNRVYSVCAVGFLPGFAFLGFLPDALATPRLETPRVHTPKGSVGIADQQTGVYPSDSPGGWNIIGRTPIEMLNSKKTQPSCIVKVGDKVKFVSIGRKEFIQLGGQL